MEENKRLYDLVISFKNGDESSFKILYELVKKPVFFNIYSFIKDKEISEDLLQDTFVKFLNNIKKVKKDSNILGLLMVMSKNICLDYLKKKKDSQIDENIHIQKNSDFTNRQTSELNLLERIKAILNDKEFNIFSLHLMSELTFDEISKYLKIPLGTITYTYSISIKKIKEEIKEEELC